jgi:tetratricopeptide (TPR) repeat protein
MDPMDHAPMDHAPTAARQIELLIAQGGTAERCAAALAALLQGRLLLDGPLPLPVLRALLGTAQHLVLVGSHRETLAFQRGFLRQHGLTDVEAVVAAPRAEALPFRPATPGDLRLDGALVMAETADSAAAGGESARTARMAAIAHLTGPGPTLAIMTSEDAARAARPVLAAGGPLALVHWGGANARPATSPPATSRSPRPHSDVAILIPTRNRAALLERAVTSALRQDLKPAEILVIDDGSTDDTARLLAGGSRDVKHLQRLHPGGQAAAMNDGIQATSTEWIAWLDDDDYFLPAKLRLQLAGIRAPDVGLAVTAHWIGDAAGAPRELRLLPEFAPGEVFRLLLRGSIFLGPTALVRRRAYDTLGARPYDETLARAADYRMWWELARHWRVVCLQVPLTVVCRHPGNALDPERARQIYDSVRSTLRWVWEAVPLAELAGNGAAAESGAHRDLNAVRLERAAALMRSGLFAEAAADFAPLAAEGSERAQALAGLAALEQGAFETAAEAFAAALGEHPESLEAANGLAAACLMQGRRAEAERVLAAALRRAPGEPLLRYHQALAAEPDPTSPGPALALARDLLAERQPRGALYSPAPPLRGLDAHFAAIRRLGWRDRSA